MKTKKINPIRRIITGFFKFWKSLIRANSGTKPRKFKNFNPIY